MPFSSFTSTTFALRTLLPELLGLSVPGQLRIWGSSMPESTPGAGYPRFRACFALPVLFSGFFFPRPLPGDETFFFCFFRDTAVSEAERLFLLFLLLPCCSWECSSNTPASLDRNCSCSFRDASERRFVFPFLVAGGACLFFFCAAFPEMGVDVFRRWLAAVLLADALALFLLLSSIKITSYLPIPSVPRPYRCQLRQLAYLYYPSEPEPRYF